MTNESGSDNFDDTAVDILGDVYVVDYPNHQVLKETSIEWHLHPEHSVHLTERSERDGD